MARIFWGPHDRPNRMLARRKMAPRGSGSPLRYAPRRAADGARPWPDAAARPSSARLPGSGSHHAPRTRQNRNGSDQPVTNPPSASRVETMHAHLRIRSGEVVTYDILRRALWPDRVPKCWRDELGELATALRRYLPDGCTITAIRGKGYVLRTPERRDRHPFGPISAAPPIVARSLRKPDDLALLRAERRADAATRPPPRPRACMCCRETFTSSGPGNRLCDPCRRRPDEIGDYSVRMPR